MLLGSVTTDVVLVDLPVVLDVVFIVVLVGVGVGVGVGTGLLLVLGGSGLLLDLGGSGFFVVVVILLVVGSGTAGVVRLLLSVQRLPIQVTM